jgi:hypothetical protein
MHNIIVHNEHFQLPHLTYISYSDLRERVTIASLTFLTNSTRLFFTTEKMGFGVKQSSLVNLMTKSIVSIMMQTFKNLW